MRYYLLLRRLRIGLWWRDIHAKHLVFLLLLVDLLLILTRRKETTADLLFSDFLPRVVELRRLQGRLEQRIALLRHVEALRLHTAENGGRFPASQADVAVPLPVDPFTGKPFEYTLTGDTARLRGGALTGEEKNPAFNLRYAVTIRK